MKILTSIAAAVVLLVPLTACSQSKEPVPEGAAEPAATQQYTCSMHPEVVTSTPGNCPQCEMELVPKT